MSSPSPVWRQRSGPEILCSSTGAASSSPLSVLPPPSSPSSAWRRSAWLGDQDLDWPNPWRSTRRGHGCRKYSHCLLCTSYPRRRPPLRSCRRRDRDGVGSLAALDTEQTGGGPRPPTRRGADRRRARIWIENGAERGARVCKTTERVVEDRGTKVFFPCPWYVHPALKPHYF